MRFQTSACIETLYTELPFLQRFRAAKEDGFDFVEFWSWTDKDLPALKDAAEAAGIGISGFNGDAELSLIDPTQQDAYLAFLQQSLNAARFLNARALTIHSNGLGEGGVVLNRCEHLSDAIRCAAMEETLCRCAAMAEEAGILLVLEPLNIVTDHVGNFLVHTETAVALTCRVNSPNLRVLFDAYHMYLNGEDLCHSVRTYGQWFGHIHLADAPGRHEPGTGEIAFSAPLACLEEIGYSGLVGFELFPAADTAAAVRAIRAL